MLELFDDIERKMRSRWGRFNDSYGSTILCIVAAVISLVNLTSFSSTSCTKERFETVEDLAHLRQPTIYPGLAELERDPSVVDWPLTRVYYPNYIAHVDSTRPSEVFRNHSRVLIDHSVSTVHF